MGAIGRLVAAGWWSTGGLIGAAALAQPAPLAASSNPPAALDVPYLAQSVLLCGGAAIVMVERWWGRRGVYPSDFANLVRPASGGIFTTDLAAATQARGWDTRVLDGTPELVQASLAAGVPVVALIQVGRDRYHYIVVLGWADGQVVFHDPARGPSISVTTKDFLARWTGAKRWALVVRPLPAAAPSGAVPAAAPAAPMPCSPWLDQALDATMENRLNEAATLLATAAGACPGEPLILRELAGVRFKQGRPAEVVPLITRYLALVPGDAHGWQLLATSRYLAGDRDGALQAWNRIGRPTVDLVRIDGTRNIRFQQIANAASVPAGTLLTASRLSLARRRVADIPAVRQSAVEYQPAAGGVVEIRAAVVERRVVENPWLLLASNLIRAVARSEVGLDVASPTGAGELWMATWSWEAARSRAALRVDLPADLGFPGVISIESARDGFRMAPGAVAIGALGETRRSAIVRFGGWLTPGVRPSAAVRLEQWSGRRSYLALAGSAELRAAGNRFGLSATGERAIALAAHPSYTRSGVRAMWTSSVSLNQTAWFARLGFDWASAAAPLGTWPVAGGNVAWAVPLRADGLSGPLAGRSTGRGIVHAGLGGDHPFYQLGPVTVAAGVFLDGARISAAADGSVNDRVYLDGGAGLRFGIGDGQLGVLRIDLARGLLDRRSALTFGFYRTWPAFTQGAR